jgi:hypothetical protein
MKMHRLAIALSVGAMLSSAGIAQEVQGNKHIHPLTGYAPADAVPIVRDSGTTTSAQPMMHQSAFASPSAAACGDGCAVECGEGCIAAEEEAACCLFGDTALLSCMRNRKSCFSDDLTYSVGGALRHRYMNEKNRLRPGVPPGGARATYDLFRFTPFVSMTYNDTVSGYVQAIDASAFGYDAPLGPVGIDVNRSDLLQYYAELNLGEIAGGDLKYRYGRQFLKYGAQHLLSPLAWSNTFRNFEGHKLAWNSGDWAVDAFSMASVNAAAGGSGFSPTAFDTADSDRQIHGVYTTYSGLENNIVDLYWLWSDERNPSTARQDGERHTFGSRLAGKKAVKECNRVVGTWAWDVEGAFQVGEDNFIPGGTQGALNQDVFAGFFSATGGYTFNDTLWTPSVGGIFYWGSGDNDPADGTNNTVHTLYPLGHAYWGLIDNFSGQNLVDYGIKATVKPHEKLTLLGAFHWFDRATANDAVYNIVGAPFAANNGGTDIGNEVDFVATYKASETLSVQAGYFWFWYGSAIGNSPQARPDASQFYVQTTLTF